MWKLNRENRILTDGDWTIREGLSDDMLAALYLDMKMSGTLDRVFHTAVPSVCEFVRDLSPVKSIGYSAWYSRPDADVILAGYGFTNWIANYPWFCKAEVGVVFTERMGAPNKNVFRRCHLAKGMISALFTLSSVESMTAVIPEPNMGSASLAGRIGVRMYGPVPNYSVWRGRPCGAFIGQTDSEKWLNQDTPVVEYELYGVGR